MDEFTDFFEDLFEHFVHVKSKHEHKKRETVIGGAVVFVRPAYIFAERIDNLIKMIFGISVIVSSISASIYGFTSLSGFVSFFVESLTGRIMLFIVGLSYLLIATWKLLHLGKGENNKR